MLYFIGLGLAKKFLTQASIEAMRKVDVLYLDAYTSLSCDINKEYLEKLLERQIILANRSTLENNSKNIIKLLKEGKSVGIATIGDPMIATTHVSLATEAKNKGYNVIIIPGISVHCYIISKSMLSSYKFGRSVTVVYPYDKILDTTPYEVIKDNSSRGLHTILYLDLKEGKPMSAKDAISLLLQMEEIKKEGIITPNTQIIIGQRLGCEDEEVKALTISEALEYKYKDPPHIIIVPSKNLHYMEVEALKCLH